MSTLHDASRRPGGAPRTSLRATRGARRSTRTERRIQAILKAATRVFFEHGYAHTTIDDIVGRAGGSKATIYKHFSNKRELFNAVIDSVVERSSQERIDFNSPDPAKTLTAYARRRVQVVFSPDHVALIRLVITEGLHSPDLVKNYYAHGPGHSLEVLTEYFRAQAERGTLAIDNPEEAAYHFSSLLMHRWYLGKLWGGLQRPSKREINQAVKSTIRAFMLLYGKR